MQTKPLRRIFRNKEFSFKNRNYSEESYVYI